MKTLILCLLTVAACGTVQPVPTPPPVDYSAVCAHLSDLGCSEGKAPECAAVFARIQDGRMSDLQPSCLMAAKTPAEVRACTSVACE